MNDSSVVELERLVEKTVRTVVATRGHKKKVREELLAHLNAVFEQEFNKLGDHAAALRQTRQRFGEPGEVSKELQRAIAWWERLAVIPLVPRSFSRRAPGQSMAIRIAFMSLLPGLLLAIVQKSSHGDLGLIWRRELALSVFIPIFAVVFYLIPGYFGRSMFVRGERSGVWIISYSLVTAAVLPLLAFVFTSISAGDTMRGVAQLWFACWFAPLGPVILFTTGRWTYRELSYNRHWAAINLED